MEETMILANTRSMLGRDDAQLALRLVARGRTDAYDACEAALREHGIDVLLDDPRLLDALLATPQASHASWPLFAYVFVRHALRQAGEDDRTIADYVASVLVHFGLRDNAHRIASHDDQRYDTLVGLVGDVNDPDARRAFLVRAHLGNYALWLSGLFPDYIEHRRWRRGGPDLDYYDEMGARGYRMAADHRLADEHGLAPLYAHAADRFPRLRRALNTVSDRLMFPTHHTPERLMRQVRDGFGVM
jgi:hypothetical protein